MARRSEKMANRATTLCRNIAVALIAGVWRGRSIHQVNEWMMTRPARLQALITGGTLAALLGLSLVAAQFGWIGMLLFWLAVVLVVN